MRPRTGIAAFVTVVGVTGAPDRVVSVTDQLGATALKSGESFLTVVAPRYDRVVRGVSFTPGTHQ
jgi:hypothetical protein